MFDANHDVCFLKFVNDVNGHSKSKSAKRSKKKNIWKPTRKVFTDIEYRWKPTGRTFTIVGNSCPFTRITSTKVELLKETTSKSVTIPNPEVKINRRRTKVAKLVNLSSEPSILGSSPSDISEPNKHWGSTVSNSPSSSLVNFRFGNDQIAKIMGYGGYQMGNVTIDRVYYVEGLGIKGLKIIPVVLGRYDVILSHLSLVKSAKDQVLVMASKVILFKLRLHHYTGQTRTGPRKPDLSYFHVVGALCYLTNDSEDLAIASEQFSSGPEPQLLTHGTISSGLVPNPPSPTPYVPPTKKDWDILFQPMFDEYFNPPPSVASHVPAIVALEPADSTGTPSSTHIDQDAPSPSTSQIPQESQSPVIPSSVKEHFHDIEVAHLDNNPFFGVPILEPNSEESSSRDIIPTNVHSVNQPPVTPS
ncbi:hypothetical protein Tco_1409992 [Tanacetum coccineum]